MFKAQSPLYARNYASLSVCGDELRFVVCNATRVAGVEGPSLQADYSNRSNHVLVHDEKLANNICRARRAIYEYAVCNPWDYFVTLTIDGDKFDRSDFRTFWSSFSKFFRPYKLAGCAYLLIPELHSDGSSWHMHGFLRFPPDVAASKLKPFRIGDTMGKYIADKVKSGKPVFDWPEYHASFGFCDLEPIANHKACSKYVCKYISKDLSRSVRDLRAHLYYHSRGLSRASVVARGTVDPSYFDCRSDDSSDDSSSGSCPFSLSSCFDFRNEYVSILTLADTPENRAFLTSLFVDLDPSCNNAYHPLIQRRDPPLRFPSLADSVRIFDWSFTDQSCMPF